MPLHDIVEAIGRYNRFLVATHARPDGDAVGSVLGLTSILRKLGKTADAYCQDPVPPAQAFLAGTTDIRRRLDDPAVYDAAVLVDCGDLRRVGDSLADSIQRIPLLINIDHHVNHAPFGHLYWVNSAASSTCEMLYDLCRYLRVPLDADLAAQLYTGLLMDTGGFRFANTNQRVLEIAAELVAAGADPAYIAEQAYESVTPQAIQLLAQVLGTVRLFADNRLATAELTQTMFNETGTGPVDSEGFINHLRSVKSVLLAMLFREDKNGTIHVSLRSKDPVDVAAFAQEHGGGGHRHAAAFRHNGNMVLVRPQITREGLSYLLGSERS